jgi:FixJ family two-component response regulator
MHDTTARQIYLVEDDVPLRRSLADLLEQSGYAVRGYARAEDFLRDAEVCEPGCLIIDLCLPGMNGLDLQRAVRRAELPLSVIAMSAQSDVELAVATVREGALDYL